MTGTRPELCREIRRRAAGSTSLLWVSELRSMPSVIGLRAMWSMFGGEMSEGIEKQRSSSVLDAMLLAAMFIATVDIALVIGTTRSPADGVGILFSSVGLLIALATSTFSLGRWGYYAGLFVGLLGLAVTTLSP